MERHVLPVLRAGRVVMPVCARVPMADAEPAYEQLAAGSTLGKIVRLTEPRR